MTEQPAEAATLFDLSGKVALVTGGASGLGRSFCRGLAAFGATVTCGDIDAAGAEETARLIRASGGRSDAVPLDVSAPSSVETAAKHVIDTHGRIDVLVNNAGIATVPTRVHELPVEDWDRLFAVNMRGTFLCTKAVIPSMLAHRGGSIVNLSSILGMSGYYPGFAATAVNYGASKAGVIGFTRQVALEYARENIRVNAIAPGWHGGTQLGRERRATATPESIEQFESAIARDTPMGRRGRPDELSGLVVYLASDASRYVTGQIFAHDGGWTAR
jgi:NAD(P)-dependent dehydrogenase (short-subunit alcohol dehydrogenase family)